MTALPVTANYALIRTDFSDPAAWAAVRGDLAQKWDDEFDIIVDVIDDPAFAGLSPEQALRMEPEDYPHEIVVLADVLTMTSPERLLLVVSLEQGDEEYEAELRENDEWDDEWAAQGRGWANEWPQRGGAFRSTAAGVGAITANLSIGNMHLWEYAGAVDEHGIFRNFESS